MENSSTPAAQRLLIRRSPVPRKGVGHMTPTISLAAQLEARSLVLGILDAGESTDSMLATARRELRKVPAGSTTYGAQYLREVVRLCKEGVLA